MTRLVLHGAMLGCSHGSAPSPLAVAPGRLADAGPRALATVTDHAPALNLAPFGLCNSLTNPAVAAATAAALGALTPQPCTPQTPAPWSQPEGGVTVDGVAALHDGATCACAWGGRIDVRSAPDGPLLRG